MHLRKKICNPVKPYTKALFTSLPNSYVLFDILRKSFFLANRLNCVSFSTPLVLDAFLGSRTLAFSLQKRNERVIAL